MFKKTGIVFLLGSLLLLIGCGAKGTLNQDVTVDKTSHQEMSETKAGETMEKHKAIKEIYLAGGCFWGLEAYFSRINGVEEVSVGYANGQSDETTYRKLSKTGHAETVHLKYDTNKLSLREVLLHYFRVIDPLSVNRQGNDIGSQYRTGIYYQNEDDLKVIEKVVKEKEEELHQKVAVEVEPLKNYVLAEDYHQDYLEKNPQGYCHLDLSQVNQPLIDKAKYPKPSKEDLKKKLTPEEYAITQEDKTEQAFTNRYWNNFEKGIYVDVVTGEPLFSSKDKYASHCGWASFSKPIAEEVVRYQEDTSFGMHRTEVRSRSGDSHLGHVFDDGPKETGGLRFCINSLAIKFIPENEMEKQGYGYLLDFI